VSVSLSSAGLGVIEGPETLGAVLEMVTLLEVAGVPVVLPSFGVTTQ
jgi:hypothetical protein